jgi:hypothetical protein
MKYIDPRFVILIFSYVLILVGVPYDRFEVHPLIMKNYEKKARVTPCFWIFAAGKGKIRWRLKPQAKR